MTQTHSSEAWRITYQSYEQAARSALDLAEKLRKDHGTAPSRVRGPLLWALAGGCLLRLHTITLHGVGNLARLGRG